MRGSGFRRARQSRALGAAPSEGDTRLSETQPRATTLRWACTEKSRPMMLRSRSGRILAQPHKLRLRVLGSRERAGFFVLGLAATLVTGLRTLGADGAGTATAADASADGVVFSGSVATGAATAAGAAVAGCAAAAARGGVSRSACRACRRHAKQPRPSTVNAVRPAMV